MTHKKENDTRENQVVNKNVSTQEKLSDSNALKSLTVKSDEKNIPASKKKFLPPNNPKVNKLICAANIYVENQQYNEAINLYQAIRKELPTVYTFDFIKIDSHLGNHDLEKAAKAYYNNLKTYKCE